MSQIVAPAGLAQPAAAAPIGAQVGDSSAANQAALPAEQDAPQVQAGAVASDAAAPSVAPGAYTWQPATAASAPAANTGINVASSVAPTASASPPLSTDPAVTNSLQDTLSAISSGSSSLPSSTQSDSKGDSSTHISSSTSSSPSPTQTKDHKDQNSGWPQMKQWVIPVAAIGACLLVFSIIGRIISLSRRNKKRRTERGSRGLPTSSGGSGDDYDEGGGFLTRNVSPAGRPSQDLCKERFSGDFNNTRNLNTLHQFESGNRDLPPVYKEPCEAELGYDDHELRGVTRAGSQPTYKAGWRWMKKTFTNEEAFGSKYTQGPPMKRSVLSFVNLSPFSDRGARTVNTPQRQRGASQLWSPAAGASSPNAVLQVTTPPGSGWRDASSPPFTSTNRGTAGRFEVPRRPVNRSYMPVSSVEADGHPSIAAVLAADTSNNRLAGDRPLAVAGTAGGDADLARSPTRRSKPETVGGVAAWREAIRKISGGGYSYTRDHERIPSSDPEDDDDGDSGDEGDARVVPSARQTSYSYRSVSQEYDPNAARPVQRSTSQSKSGLQREVTLARKSTMATQRTNFASNDIYAQNELYSQSSQAHPDAPYSIPALQRKRTIKLPAEDASPSRAASRISRSPSKYPGGSSEQEDEEVITSPAGLSDAKSIMSVDTETQAVLRHLDSKEETAAETPEAGSVINFDPAAVTGTPSSSSPSRMTMQRQGTIRSYLSSGGENTGKREQRLRRAETVVENAVKRAATLRAQKSDEVEQIDERQRLRRAATAASSSSRDTGTIDFDSNRTDVRALSRPSALKSSPSRREASLTVPSTSMYNLARKSLVTQTPDVPQFHGVSSPDAVTPQVSSDERSSIGPPDLERTYTTSSGRSENASSGEEGPPSLVHGSTTSEEDDEARELASNDGHVYDPMSAREETSLGKSGHVQDSQKAPSYISASPLSEMATPQYMDTLAAYRVEIDSPASGEDVFAAMGRLGSHNLDCSLKSPLAGQDDGAMTLPGNSRSVGTQINDALTELSVGESAQSGLKRSSPTRKGLTRSPTRKALPDIDIQEATPTESERAAFEAEEAQQYAYSQPKHSLGQDKVQGIELFDPPVGWRSESEMTTDAETPKKRSWKQRNGRWVAAEEDCDNPNDGESGNTSPERAVSPPPLPSPPKSTSLMSATDGSPVTPRRVARYQRQNTSDTGDASLTPSRRRQRTETPEARLKATTSPASPSPFGRHADLFFSPPIGSGGSPNSASPRVQGVPGGGKYRRPRNMIASAGSPLRAPTTRTNNILAADRVNGRDHQRESPAVTSGSETDEAGNHRGSETPVGTSALNSLAFSSPFAAGMNTPLSVVGSPPPAPRSEVSSSSDTTYQHSDIGGSRSSNDLLRRNTALNAGASRPRRGTVSSHTGSTCSSEYGPTDAPTVSSGVSTHEAAPRMNKKSTKSNATLSSVFTTKSESEAALTEAEQKGRAGLDVEIQKMLHRRSATEEG